MEKYRKLIFWILLFIALSTVSFANANGTDVFKLSPVFSGGHGCVEVSSNLKRCFAFPGETLRGSYTAVSSGIGGTVSYSAVSDGKIITGSSGPLQGSTNIQANGSGSGNFYATFPYDAKKVVFTITATSDDGKSGSSSVEWYIDQGTSTPTMTSAPTRIPLSATPNRPTEEVDKLSLSMESYIEGKCGDPVISKDETGMYDTKAEYTCPLGTVVGVLTLARAGDNPAAYSDAIFVNGVSTVDDDGFGVGEVRLAEYDELESEYYHKILENDEVISFPAQIIDEVTGNTIKTEIVFFAAKEEDISFQATSTSAINPTSTSTPTLKVTMTPEKSLESSGQPSGGSGGGGQQPTEEMTPTAEGGGGGSGSGEESGTSACSFTAFGGADFSWVDPEQNSFIIPADVRYYTSAQEFMGEWDARIYLSVSEGTIWYDAKATFEFYTPEDNSGNTALKLILVQQCVNNVIEAIPPEDSLLLDVGYSNDGTFSLYIPGEDYYWKVVFYEHGGKQYGIFFETPERQNGRVVFALTR